VPRASRRFGDPAFDDAALYEVREKFARFADDHPEAAHRWRLRNDLIPDEVIAEMARLGVFGLTMAEAWAGAGMAKLLAARAAWAAADNAVQVHGGNGHALE
jgi:(2S)-methylsuccinyl-CoA dehydrogenase